MSRHSAWWVNIIGGKNKCWALRQAQDKLLGVGCWMDFRYAIFDLHIADIRCEFSICTIAQSDF